MMEKIKTPLIFVAGLAVGSVATWLIVRNKYRTEKEEEIASVKEVYAKRFDDINKEAMEKAAISRNKPDISVYTHAIEESRQRNAEVPDTEVEDEDQDEEEIKSEFTRTTGNLYEITSSEFASYTNDRTRITLTLFADDIFADEMYEEVDPMEYLSGPLIPLTDSKPVNCMDYIHRMVQDEICIRNFDLNLDIDIVTESRTYSDYMAT